MKLAFVYVTDERGFELARHSAMSLALSQREPCDIHFFCYRFSPMPPPEFSAAMSRLRISLSFDSISDAAVERHPTGGHVTTAALLKLPAIGKLVSQYDRVVYLDNDILVFDDLKIRDLDLGQAPIAAVIDMDLSHTGWLRNSRWSAVGDETDDLGGYFNSGFMIAEARNWRSEEFNGQYAAALDQHDRACPYKIDCTSTDQCALNSVFENRWLKLPASYNMQAGAKFTRWWKTAVVRHYCGPRKFIPISPLRNDSRDVRYLNEIRQAAGLSQTVLPAWYEILFRFNVIRKYRGDAPIRRFLGAIEARSTTAPLA